MQDKYSMTVEDNILYAKRNIVDNIYRSARLEGIGITFPETQMIYEGKSVSGLSIDDVIKVNNLKHAWQFIFDSIEYPMDLMYLKQLNQEIGVRIVPNAGVLRSADVRIGGTTWRPDIPDEDNVKEKLNEIMSIENVTDRAITLMLYLMRAQLFYDGNKRVGQLAANQVMIQNGAGIISIPVECQQEFFEKLVKFYETNDMTDIKEMIYNTSIDGMDVTNDLNREQPGRDFFIKNSRGKTL